MDLYRLRAGGEHRELLFKLRHGETGDRMGLHGLRADQHGKLLYQLRSGKTGGGMELQRLRSDRKHRKVLSELRCVAGCGIADRAGGSDSDAGS